MVIRKPYAFLIRHFRLIHFLIIIPMFITLLCTRTVANFFAAYVASGYVTNEINLASTYINPFVYLCLILIIGSVIAIILLLKSKDKDIKAHLIISIFYFILLIVYIILPSFLSQFETTDVSATMSRVFRDLSSFLYYIQYIFIILTFIKGLGFDFERFQFIDLLSELEIDTEDSDEVEFRIGVEGYKAKRKIRYLLREFKAYLLENKFFVSILLGIVIIVLSVVLFINISGNHSIRVNQGFSLSGFNAKFNKSILSNLDFNGHEIAKGKYYLAVNVYIKNVSNKSQVLDTSLFHLDLGKKNYIYPIPAASGYFLDYGRPYYSSSILPNEECEYLLVYELTEEDIQNKYTIKVLNSVVYKKNEVIPKYTIITLNPLIIDRISSTKEVDLGTEVSFSNTNLLNTKLKIDSYTLTNRYVYEYDFCIDEDCVRSKNSVTPDPSSSAGEFTLIALNGAFTLDGNSTYSKYKLMTNNFFSDFMEIEYTVGESTHISKVEDKTPKELTGTTIIQVPKMVEQATSINLVITVRNIRYIYKLK